MTDILQETTQETPAPRKRRVKRAAPRRKARSPSAEPHSDFPGLTVSNCPDACRENRCAITHHGFCGHPRKGGLQGADQHNPEIVERFTRAKLSIAHAAVDAKK